MNWKFCTAMILGSATFLVADGPKGTEPRPAAAGYPAHTEIAGVAVGASLLSADQARRNFVSDVNRCCLVVEVAVYPPKDKPLSVSLNDFVLRIKDTGVAAKPSSAKVIASSLQKKARDDRDVTVSPSYGVTYQSGRGYDPVTGTSGSGVTHTAGVLVGVGHPGPNPASTDKDRSAMEAELSEKGLPEGAAATPVSGYVYFPLSSQKKNAVQLEYKLGGEKVVLALP
ncbi:MAG: hypothetical protein WB952_09750 [Terriglobales bacterium]